MIYSKTWGGTQPYVAFSTLQFDSFLCSWRNTHVTKFSYNAQASVCCLVASLLSWLTDAACLPCLSIKTTSGEGSLLMWGGCVCCNSLSTPVNLRTTGTEGWQFVLSFHCVKFVSIMLYVSLSVLPPIWAEMSLSSN